MDVNLFIEQARAGLAEQTGGHSGVWNLDKAVTWNADLELGTIDWVLPNEMTAQAKIQVVGTYNTENGSFLWGWDHPSVPEPLRADAKLAQAWGQENGLSSYTERKVDCTEDEAWEFSAVTCRLANANGVYSGASGSARVFMTFGNVTLKKEGQVVNNLPAEINASETQPKEVLGKGTTLSKFLNFFKN